MKPKASFEIDGIDSDDADRDDVLTVDAKASEAAPRVQPEIAKKREEYLRDWRYRMNTHLNVQREYMGRGRGRAGEYS